MKLRLNKIQYPIYNLGPGKRIGIWVQGCDLGCQGCINQTLWAADGGRSVEVLELFNWLVAWTDHFDGITISGGEPFQQYEALVTFLHLVKQKTTYDTYCFTGYYLKELDALFPDKLFYRYIDYLVDGRYEARLHDNQNQKGSSNQTLYRFFDGKPIAVEQPASAKWSVRIGEDNRIHMAGVPKRDDLAMLRSDLARAGITKEFK
jgi:anaerobic ribonucleoside-triphosphate reductase activating protein